MDRTEAHVERYLRHLGYQRVQYEPDGNVPPDFLVDDSIAVEVRRLNQHEEGSSGLRGLESLEFQLRSQVEGLLSELGPPTRGKSWFVSYFFSRPLEPWKTLRPKVQRWLAQFRSSAQVEKAEVHIGRFHVSLVQASECHASLFVLGGYGDHDAGGWLMSELDRNIRLCLQSKTQKIAAHRSKYAEWWLVLVDHIAHGLGNEECRLLAEQPPIPHNWDRVVILDSADVTRAFVLPAPEAAG